MISSIKLQEYPSNFPYGEISYKMYDNSSTYRIYPTENESELLLSVYIPIYFLFLYAFRILSFIISLYNINI